MTNAETRDAEQQQGSERRHGRGVAIVGMACMFPGAPDLQAYWQNIVNKVDAVDDVPRDRWDPDVFHDPTGNRPGRVYCKSGGYLPASIPFDPVEFGIMPSSIPGAETDQFIALKVASDALADAGYLDRRPASDRVELVLGRGNYLGPGFVNLIQRGPIVEQTLDILRRLRPEYGPEELAEIAKELRAGLPPFGPETAAGMIPNLTTGRVANRLGFSGPNFTVDAACASSLIATDIGMRDLLAGRCDLALAGGVHVFNNVPFLMVFCALHALSPSSTIRPFDRTADGTLPGEGVGVVVLKRTEDAERDGDRIYAVIRGVGTSSDGRAASVTAPNAEGEELALREAYAAAGVRPETVRLIEAHGTGTAVGDSTELEALLRTFGSDGACSRLCALGTVKSMIGHAMPAAAVAGLIKTALALYHRVLPPTLHCDEPRSPLDSKDSFFYVNTETRPWVHGSRRFPRRAGVDAFGFGGTNAHAVLEEHPGAAGDGLLRDWGSEAIIVSAASRRELQQRGAQVAAVLERHPEVSLKDLAFTLNTQIGQAPWRLAIVASSAQDLGEKLGRALERIAASDCHQIKDVRGVYFFADPIGRQGTLALLFPGEGSQYVNMLRDLCIHFPEVRACFDEADRTAEELGVSPPSRDVFPPPFASEQERQQAERRLWEIERATEAVLTADAALFTMLDELGIRPDVMVGHSAGEWAAMAASGIFDLQQFLASFDRLHRVYEQLSHRSDIPSATMLAVGADRETVQPILDRTDGTIYVANDNCPHQVVVAGEGAAVDKVIQQLKAQGVPFEKLPFDRGYHTPLFSCVCEPLREYFSSLRFSSPKTPVYSCTTGARCPTDPAELLELAVHTFARPLLFRETIETMYADGVRLFVEAGPKGNLTAFVDDILRGRPHLAVAADVPRRSGVTQLNHLVALLAAQGVPMKLDYLYARRAPARLALDDLATGAGQPPKRRTTVELKLSFPAMSVAPRAPAAEAAAPAASLESPGQLPPAVTSDAAAPVVDSAVAGDSEADAVMEQHFATMRRFLQVQQETMAAYLNDGGTGDDWDTPGAEPAGQGPFATSAAPTEAPVEPKAVPGGAGDHSTVETGSDQADSAPQHVASPAKAAATPAELKAALLDLVSEKTGYPKDMLDVDLDMEADLGIDSIKRIEVLGALQQKFPDQFPTGGDEADIEQIASQRTLRQLMTYLQEHAPAAGAASPSSESSELPKPGAAAGEPGETPSFPLLGEVAHVDPGQQLTCEREVSVDEDLFLADHAFGRQVSAYDRKLSPLPVVPMTMTLEMMAEAAAALAPQMRVVALNDARTLQWIQAPPGEPVALQITARRLPAAPDRVQVQVRRASGAETAGEDAAVLARATAVLAEAYPAAPVASEIVLAEARPPKITAGQLYDDHWMFHGPSFQGVVSMDEIGRDGVRAGLQTLPRDRLFHSCPKPDFVLDPCLLDAGGQMVGYWPLEYLERRFVVFPVGIQELQLFGPPPAPGEAVACQVRVRETSQQLVRADLDFVDAEGRVRMRVIGWQDWRFDWPKEVYRFWKFPERTIPSRRVALFGSQPAERAVCCVAKTWGEFSSELWQGSWACLLLSGRERETYRKLSSEKRRTEWLLGRTAAKDAVRSLVKQQKDVDLYPADIDVESGNGCPVVGGEWRGEGEAGPAVSIAHAGALAVAAASSGERVGVDVEPVRELEPSFEAAALCDAERALLDSLGSERRREWLLRFWCAKEAVAKALGVGLKNGPRSVEVTAADAPTGVVWVALSDELAAAFADLASARLRVYTRCEEGYALAGTLCEKG